MTSVFEKNIEALWRCRLLGITVTNGCYDSGIEFSDLVLSRYDLEEHILSLMPSLVFDEEFYARINPVRIQTRSLALIGTEMMQSPAAWAKINLPSNSIIERTKGDLVYNLKCNAAFYIATARAKALLYESIVKAMLRDKAIVNYEESFIRPYVSTPDSLFEKSMFVLETSTNSVSNITQLQDNAPNEIESSVISFIRLHIYYLTVSERLIWMAKREELLSDEEIANILKLF